MLRLVTEVQTRFAEQMVNADVLGDGLGYIKFIENFGSDERIIESARMSTGKGFLGWGPRPTGIICMPNGEPFDGKRTPLPDFLAEAWEKKGRPAQLDSTNPFKDILEEPGDEKLLRYLWENKHATPFEMGGFTIEVKAPIMVFREWHRHRTQSYNEFSARYSVMPEEFYVPTMARMRQAAQSQKNKQGSGELLSDEISERARMRIMRSSAFAFQMYNENLDDGVAKEIARLDLPVNTYSKMRASTDLRNWFSFLTLRDDPAAQWEIQQFAKVVAQITQAIFPRSYGLYEEGRKNWREFNAWMIDRKAA